MISEELEFQISQYADGTLPAEEVAALEAVLASDADARALLADFRKLDTTLKREMPLPEVKWDRLAEHISAAVADEDRATTTYTISRWWIRAAVAAIVVIAFGIVALWPRGNGTEVANTPAAKPVFVIDVGGPEPATQPAIVQIAIEPSNLAQNANHRIAEDIIYRPPRVVIASGDPDRQDTPRLPY